MIKKIAGQISSYTFIVLVLLPFILTSCNKGGQEQKDVKKNDGSFSWKEKIGIEDIPDAPLKAFIKGQEIKIDYINFEKWRGSGDNVINWGDKKPAQPCGFVDNDLAIHFLRKAGDIVKGNILKAGFDNNLDNYTLNYHYYEGGNIKKVSVPWNCALQIDEITDDVVKGRIAICLKDDTKSWIAGKFEAVKCLN